MLKEIDDTMDRAARDGSGRLASMPLPVGRYLRNLDREGCRELGQWLLRRSEDDARVAEQIQTQAAPSTASAPSGRVDVQLLSFATGASG
jgi:hypothetical protein